MDKRDDMIQEEEFETFMLTDENGQECEFELLDVMEYQGSEYMYLMPVEGDSNELLILRIEPVDEEMENYVSIDNEEELQAVYELFKERYKDVLTFED